MPIVYLELIMASLAFALCVIVFMGLRVVRGMPALQMPRLRLPSIDLRSAMPSRGPARELPDSREDRAQSKRLRQLAAVQPVTRLPEETVSPPESFIDETMRSLEQAFNSFESGRVGAETYRSVLLAVRRAVVRRRTGLAARDEQSGADADVVSAELAEANMAVEAVEWCLDWLEDFERSREAA